MSPPNAKAIYCISFSAVFNQARIPAWKPRAPKSSSGNMVTYKSLILRGYCPRQNTKGKISARLELFSYKCAIFFNPWWDLLRELMQDFTGERLFSFLALGTHLLPNMVLQAFPVEGL